LGLGGESARGGYFPFWHLHRRRRETVFEGEEHSGAVVNNNSTNQKMICIGVTLFRSFARAAKPANLGIGSLQSTELDKTVSF